MHYAYVPAHPLGGPPVPTPGAHFLIVAIAEKGAESTDDVQPVQSVYRVGEEINAVYRERQSELMKNPRPIFTDGRDLSPPFTEYLIPVGKLGVDLV
jgi:hypothetical protein